MSGMRKSSTTQHELEADETEGGRDLDSFLSEVDAEDRADRKAERSGRFADLLGQGGKKARKKKDSTQSKRPGRSLPKFGKQDKSDSDVHQWTNGSNLTAKAGTAAMVVAMVAGPAALAMQLTQKPPTVAAQGSGFDTRMMNRRDAANDVATQFVSTWLSAGKGQEGQLSAFRPGVDTNDVTLPQKPSSVTQTSVIRSEPVGPGVWSVTVSADVLAPGAKTSTHRYFRVPVSVSGSDSVAAQALALPAEVPGPSHRAGNTALSYPSTVAPSDPAATMTSQFLTAMLTGQNNIGLYEAPGTSIPAVENPVWKSVRVVELKAADGSALSQVKTDGTKLHVQASVALSPAAPKNGSSDSSLEPSAQYQLTLTARAGRWEISSLDTSPQLSVPTERTSAK